MGRDTPLMQQYKAIKQKHQDAILFFRMGDFYEMFFEDAKVSSKILDIALTSRDKNKDGGVPLCGIPHHAADNYLAKLVRAGKKVAVCEQVEDPKQAKGIVKRAVVRVVTPGTIHEQSLLSDRENNYLIAVNQDSKSNLIGLAVCDMTTGEFRVTELKSENELKDELARLQPRECIIPRDLYADQTFLQTLKYQESVSITPFDDWAFEFESAEDKIKKQFEVTMLDGFGLADKTVSIQSAGALAAYLTETQRVHLKHLQAPKFYTTNDFMLLDEATIRNLELVMPLRAGDRKATLLGILDKCVTAMGGRLLHLSLLQPLNEAKQIKARQEVVAEFYSNRSKLDESSELLDGVADIERLAGRLGNETANARDLLALEISLENIAKLKESLKDSKSKLLQQFYKQLDPLQNIIKLVQKSIRDDAPALLREGKLIKRDYNSELDRIMILATEGKDWLKNLETEERQKTKIEKLKVRFNKVFGYYIEVPKSQVNKVPENYIRKQTLVNAERYITPEMKEREDLILNSEEKLLAKEYEIFCVIREEVAKTIPALQKNSRAVAMIDMLATFARLALERNYIKPQISENNTLRINEGRHPVVEQIENSGEFVPNDVLLDKKEQVIILTGPNMSGKSTYIRQVALITLMAQIGSFVPASEANIGVVDRIFTRVGASDNLVRGQSTFMVEMQEAANILNSATDKSLVIFDEVGRGTSTFDGISIAWAMVEYLHNGLKTKTLFATHYHELLELEKLFTRVFNYNIAVKENKSEVNFLYKIVKGGTDRSYGIYVGKLAGLPKPVINRAEEVLKKLDKGEELFKKEIDRTQVSEKQTSLFEIKESEVEKKLAEIDVDNLTPVEALQKLDELKKV